MKKTTVAKQPARTNKDATIPPTPPSLRREAGLVLSLCAVSMTCLSLSFSPYELWPLMVVGLAPWAFAVCHAARPWLVYWGSFLAGWVFFLVNLVWLMPATGLGYVALAFYLAMYWPLAAWAIRTGQRRGVSPIWALPIVWVACELLRAWVMSGFPWFFVAHAFYKQLAFIQISDLTGAYGVSFVILLINGVLVELFLLRWPAAAFAPRRRQLAVGVVVAVLAVIASLGYGSYRIRTAQFREGPRVAVVQHDFPLRSQPPYGDPFEVVFARYLALGAAAAQTAPDLLVFPETAWNAVQNIDFLEVERRAAEGVSAAAWLFGSRCHSTVAAFARGDYGPANEMIAELERILKVLQHQKPDQSLPSSLPRLPAGGGPPVTIVLGSQSVETFPESAYPPIKRYNSALLYDRDGTQRRVRYDKNHLVPFGEVVPFRYGRLHWLYRWLNSLSPFSRGGEVDYSLTPGRELTVFTLETDSGTYRFGTPICYEDVLPYVVRHYVWDGADRRTDFLTNISNDGWFLHSAELPQHLAICAFRAVENRVGIARAVNTGISGFIDPNGRIYSLVETDGRLIGPGVIGFRTDHVYLDQRRSLYGRFGDWFAGACLVVTCVAWLEAVCARWIASLHRHWGAFRERRRKKC
ncbi:MAG: apolipoprotein N-acyltransferase [Planctomycetes bacterium]|nr:apolipoprotein N-acyltransferase [Planctomycetota bacterium]